MSNDSATKSALIYLIFGVIWIFVGDVIVDISASSFHWSATTLLRINIAKGILYVVLSTLLIYFMVKVANDTIRRNLQRATKIENEAFELLEKIDESFVLVGNDERVRYVNRVFADASGRKRSSFIGKPIWECFPIQLSDDDIDRYRAVMAERKSKTFEEFNLQRDRFYMVSTQPHGSDALVISIRDITETRRSEAARARESAQMELIFNNSMETIWSVDKDYNLLLFNKAFEQTFLAISGRLPQKGDHVLSNQPEKTRHEWEKRYERVLTGERFSVRDEVLNREGKVRVFEVHLYPLWHEEDIYGLACFGTDVTDSEAARKLEQEHARIMEKMAWITAHELRGPITTIMGLVNVFKMDENVTTRNQDLIGGIQEASDVLDRITRDVVLQIESMQNIGTNDYDSETPK